MDDCPSCGARLPGAPQWCPRCLTRRDAAQAPVHALVHGGTPAPDLSPSWQANAPPPAPPARRPTASAIYGSDASPPTQPPPSSATTRIRRTVVKAIVLGFVLQLVVLALATGLHMELARAVTFGVVLTLGFYGVVLAMVH